MPCSNCQLKASDEAEPGLSQAVILAIREVLVAVATAASAIAAKATLPRIFPGTPAINRVPKMMKAKITAVPRSRPSITRKIAAPPTANSGYSTRCGLSISSSRFEINQPMYIISASFKNSDGCNVNPAIESQLVFPFTEIPINGTANCKPNPIISTKPTRFRIKFSGMLAIMSIKLTPIMAYKNCREKM